MAKQLRASGTGRKDSAAGLYYKVLARRWRPSQFAELVGQEAIAQALEGAIEAGRVAHAYLFTGARGVGKTSTARILAKALNCSDGPSCTPCDRCDICQSVSGGDDIDVLEIDGASNRGIDEVRELRQNAQFRPTRSRYKIYIIDEVHMLTREAFNALLKILEEPPEHVKFIFATTDPQKIPITILSRCQRFDFAGIKSELIAKRLGEIIENEQTEVDHEVLELLARRAGGSMRDAQSLLDQLLAFGDKRIGPEQVYRLLGTASEDLLLELAGALVAHDAARAIRAVDRAESEAVQLGALIDQLLAYYRDLMVVQSAGQQARLSSVSEQARRQIVELASQLPTDSVLAAMDILAETKSRMRGSDNARVLVDLALVRIARLEDLKPLVELLERLAAIESHLGPPPSEAGVRRLGQPPRRAQPHSGTESAVKKKAAPTESRLESSSSPAEPVVLPEPLSVETAAKLIEQLSEELSPVLGQSLSRAKLSLGPEPNLLVVQFDAVYNSAQRVRQIESLVQQRVGSGVRVRADLCKEEHSARPVARMSYTERLGEAARDPLVQEAIDLFEARVVRVDES